MPICIECCYPVSQLYHVLHSGNHKSAAPTPRPSVANLLSASKTNVSAQKAPENKSRARITGIGSDVRLTQCPRCKRFADKYVEHDFVVLFIDLVLVKPQVSEHRNVVILEQEVPRWGGIFIEHCTLNCLYRMRTC